MKFIIVGMGNFGAYLAARLTDKGHEVIGVDSDMSKIEGVKDKVTHTICMNATDKQAVKNLPIKDTDVVLIAIGEDMGASIMATAVFKELKAKRIISRAITNTHETVIKAIGIDEIIHPEEETAERLAKKLEMKGVIDSFDISDGYNIVELNAPNEFIGKTIGETDVRNRFNVNILTIIKVRNRPNLFGDMQERQKVLGVVSGSTVIEEGDILVLFGDIKDIQKVLDLNEE
ncbi:potassium channel family protein [Echinicola vietnamensis]|uniref:K+ transport system, NAD-binding component n=1 Tax=Echinicola vietnamensis (strain DSM 17526 / LMG 23754 / KMM 6221) TaxID=926556 RepID=L0FYJ2_ECHVK|nr:TrkA family potassium uptake protein [Echinicola vietnamensis]AGA77831.1 K+ transport system, NAD-binding component [Echinicola vietnamensis DSM 17526]